MCVSLPRHDFTDWEEGREAFLRLHCHLARTMDVRHFVIIECSHLANGCTIKYGRIGLILCRYLSCLGAIICYINTIAFVSVYAFRFCDALVASCSTAR